MSISINLHFFLRKSEPEEEAPLGLLECRETLGVRDMFQGTQASLHCREPQSRNTAPRGGEAAFPEGQLHRQASAQREADSDQMLKPLKASHLEFYHEDMEHAPWQYRGPGQRRWEQLAWHLEICLESGRPSRRPLVKVSWVGLSQATCRACFHCGSKTRSQAGLFCRAGSCLGSSGHWNCLLQDVSCPAFPASLTAAHTWHASLQRLHIKAGLPMQPVAACGLESQWAVIRPVCSH